MFWGSKELFFSGIRKEVPIMIPRFLVLSNWEDGYDLVEKKTGRGRTQKFRFGHTEFEVVIRSVSPQLGNQLWGSGEMMELVLHNRSHQPMDAIYRPKD